MDLVDGYDELPKAAQEKVQRALANGHVDDEDWKGVGHIYCHACDLTDMSPRILR
jgi:hypothetical protein